MKSNSNRTEVIHNDLVYAYDNPTGAIYNDLVCAYDFFNELLFDNQLPRCLITMQRKNKTYGYFSRERFISRDEQDITDEIALNPAHFRERTDEQILSTLVHEMVHLWQFHLGKPSRGGYHNREWAERMKALGLMPSDTGEPGGRQTGQRVSHYIVPEGAFAVACGELLSLGVDIRYVEKTVVARNVAKKAASKTKYTCPSCGLNA